MNKEEEHIKKHDALMQELCDVIDKHLEVDGMMDGCIIEVLCDVIKGMSLKMYSQK